MDHVPSVSAGKAAEAVERNQSAGADPVLPKLQAGSRGGDWARGWAECAAKSAKSGAARRVIQQQNGRKTACFVHEILAAGYVRAPGRAGTRAGIHTHSRTEAYGLTHSPQPRKFWPFSAETASPLGCKKNSRIRIWAMTWVIYHRDGREKQQKRPHSGVQFGHQPP